MSSNNYLPGQGDHLPTQSGYERCPHDGKLYRHDPQSGADYTYCEFSGTEALARSRCATETHDLYCIRCDQDESACPCGDQTGYEFRRRPESSGLRGERPSLKRARSTGSNQIKTEEVA